jgi:anaerobic selenocysteine-containing dehydrogenase
MPGWQPDAGEERQAARWPLRLLTAPGYFQSHTAFSGVPFCAGARVHPVAFSTSKRPARDLSDGQHVRPFNDRGSVGLVLRVSDEIQLGNVLVPGQRPDTETVAGTINMLCTDRYTDIGEGATYQSTWLDLTAWAESLPKPSTGARQIAADPDRR